MPRFPKIVNECAVCGTEAQYTYMGFHFTDSEGSRDLDSRSLEMKPSALSALVHRCPGCGYCAYEVDSDIPLAKAVVRSPEYIKQLSDPTHPELANSFVCKAMIDEEVGDYAEAAWAFIHAAWVCDDAAKTEEARMCRNDAVYMIQEALESGMQFTDDEGLDIVVRADLLRRAGLTDIARQFINEKRPTMSESTFSKVCDFEIHLLDIGDEACHTVSEALDENGVWLTDTSDDMPDDLVVSDPEEPPVVELESTEEVTKCAVCGTEATYTYKLNAAEPWRRSLVRATETEYTHIGSSIRFGSPDLDNRPPETERSAISTWVHRCPCCGYCASAVDVFIPSSKELVRRAAYAEQLSDPNFPELANSFICKSMISNNAGDYAEAAWDFIHAAWVCDDAAKTEEARMCRINAAEMIERVLDVVGGYHYNHLTWALQDYAESDTVIQVDVLRRAGRTAEARRLTKGPLLAKSPFTAMMCFERYLLDIGDETCHTVSEALDENGVWLTDTSDDMPDDFVDLDDLALCDPEEAPVDAQEEEFEFTDYDNQAIELAMNVARKLLQLPRVTPQQIIGIGNALYALERLPSVTPGVHCEFGVIYGGGTGESYEKHYVGFRISEYTFEIHSGNYVYDESMGGDSNSQLIMMIKFGCSRQGNYPLSYLEDEVITYINLDGKISVHDESSIEDK